MTSDELLASERLYNAIRDLPSWYPLIAGAEDSYETSLRRTAGTLLSSVLIAAGEESEPLAVAGELDGDYTGRLIVIYSTMIVTVDGQALATENASHTTQIWPLDRVSDLGVEAWHSYYDGTDRAPRHTKFAFRFNLGGERVRLQATAYSHHSPLLHDAALLNAFHAVRAHLTRS